MTPETQQGIQHYQAKRYTEALASFTQAADQGDDFACYYLYFMHRLAQGTNFNLEKSDAYFKRFAKNQVVLAWIQQQAANDDSKAQAALGKLLYNKKDKQAFIWLTQAAVKDEPTAQEGLAHLFWQGLGIEKNIPQAAYWFHQAAQQGNVPAQVNLGLLYFQDDGVKKDYTGAAYWWQKATEQGFPQAQYLLGLLYQSGGYGVKRDIAKAFYWYQKAANQGDRYAQTNLGLAYYKGDGVKQDYALAAYWWQKAAEQDVPEAQYDLGILHEHGFGVEQNLLEAIDWYRKAAVQGHKEAVDNLKDLYSSAIPGLHNNPARAWFWRMQESKIISTFIIDYLRPFFRDRQVDAYEKATVIADEISNWPNLKIMNFSGWIDSTILTLTVQKLNELAQHKELNIPLETLNLAYCKLDDDCLEALQSLFTHFPHLKEIDLSKNNLSVAVVTSLCEIIRQHPKLVKLDLSQNPLIDEVSLTTIESLLQLNRECGQEYEQALSLSRQTLLLKTTDSAAAQDAYLEAIAIVESLADKNFFLANSLLTELKLSLGLFYAEHNQLALALETLQELLDRPGAATALADAIFRAEQLPFTESLDKFRLCLLLLRDEKQSIEQNKDALTLLRQCIHVLQQRSPKAMATADLTVTELIQAGKLIPYHQLQAAAQQVKVELEKELSQLKRDTAEAGETLKQQLKGQSKILYATIEQLQNSTAEEIDSLERQIVEFETLITKTAAYSREAFNRLLEHPAIRETLEKQYGTSNIQVFENFLALPPEQQPDAYKQQLLKQVFTWSARELATMRTGMKAPQVLEEEMERSAIMADNSIEEQQAQELAKARAELVDYQRKHPLQQTNITPDLNLNQQPAEPNKALITIFTASVSLLLGVGLATGLFFLGFPLSTVAIASVVTALVHFSMCLTGIFLLQKKRADLIKKQANLADSLKNELDRLLPTRIQYAAPYTASKSVTVSPSASPDAPQPPIPTANKNFSPA